MNVYKITTNALKQNFYVCAQNINVAKSVYLSYNNEDSDIKIDTDFDITKLAQSKQSTVDFLDEKFSTTTIEEFMKTATQPTLICIG